MVAGWLFGMQPWSMAVRELAIPRHCYVPFPNLYLMVADAPSQTVLVAIAASLKMSQLWNTSATVTVSLLMLIPSLMLSLTNISAYLHMVNRFFIYRIAGNFRGVLIFVIFVTIPPVTKFSTHEIFHPRIFSRLLRIGLRESRNLKPRKLILKTRDSFSRKFAPPKITRYTVFSL